MAKYAAARAGRRTPILDPMTMLRPFAFVLLTGLMTLTGMGAAMARGQMAADGVICGTGEVSIVLAADGLPLFDAEGDPVEAQALPCLDCVFGQIALIPDSPVSAPVDMTVSALVAIAPPALSAAPWRMGGKGRSPPCAA
jgi:hypothetical protein